MNISGIATYGVHFDGKLSWLHRCIRAALKGVDLSCRSAQYICAYASATGRPSLKEGWEISVVQRDTHRTKQKCIILQRVKE
eukprot:scaffold76804_cov32-Prasinocladus_malaysianus.AAC.1